MEDIYLIGLGLLLIVLVIVAASLSPNKNTDKNGETKEKDKEKEKEKEKKQDDKKEIKKKIYFVRHGEPIKTDDRNPGLNENGVKQAGEVKGEAQLVIVSPLKRCQETFKNSKIVFKRIVTSDLFREWKEYGPYCWLENEPDSNLKETREQFNERCVKAWQFIQDQPETEIAVIAHGDLMATMLHFKNVEKRFNYAEAFLFDFGQDKKDKKENKRKKTIYFTRHAEPIKTDERNPGLSENGISQAKKIIGPVQLVIASPLKRCQETLKHSNLSFQRSTVEPLFREMIDGGAYCLIDGENVEQIKETHQQFLQRCAKAWQFIEQQPESEIAVVAHGVFNGTMLSLKHVDKKFFHAEVFKFDYYF